jgi:inorganic pyrophosphatase
MRLDEIPTFAQNGIIHVVVESPRGFSAKLRYDRQLGAITLARPLPAGLAYPHDWGFVPGTEASDGDPVDALVLSDVGTAPGVVIACRPIGVLEIEQNRRTQDGRERNDRIIAVPQSAPRFDSIKNVCELPDRWRDEIAGFFIQSGAFERKDVTVLGWKGPDYAFGLVGGDRRTSAAAGDR